MTPEQYKIVRVLFFALCDLPEDYKARCLDRACSDDPGLRSELQAILEEDARASGLSCDTHFRLGDQN